MQHACRLDHAVLNPEPAPGASGNLQPRSSSSSLLSRAMTVSWLGWWVPKGRPFLASVDGNFWRISKGGKGQREHTLKGNMMRSHWMEWWNDGMMERGFRFWDNSVFISWHGTWECTCKGHESIQSDCSPVPNFCPSSGHGLGHHHQTSGRHHEQRRVFLVSWKDDPWKIQPKNQP